MTNTINTKELSPLMLRHQENVEIFKEEFALSKKKKVKEANPMTILLANPEVKKIAKEAYKYKSQKEALTYVNNLLEEFDMLPKKDGKVLKIGVVRFKKLLPKPRKESADKIKWTELNKPKRSRKKKVLTREEKLQKESDEEIIKDNIKKYKLDTLI